MVGEDISSLQSKRKLSRANAYSKKRKHQKDYVTWNYGRDDLCSDAAYNRRMNRTPTCYIEDDGCHFERNEISMLEMEYYDICMMDSENLDSLFDAFYKRFGYTGIDMITESLSYQEDLNMMIHKLQEIY